MFTGIIEELVFPSPKTAASCKLLQPPYWAAQSWGTALPSTVPV